ncbi:MAG: adenosylhomocysteinase [Propionibacteriaceae bacterium]|jgi:adenosylhomocysteinase|nr:adenosylhomocysteinase [Propionibacteriaceae bacterium]
METTLDYRVADLNLAAAGRREIALAEHEMPGLMAMRKKFSDTRPLAGARITGSLHMTVETAILIETLVTLGAEVRWASCNIFSTQDAAAAAAVVGPQGSVEKPAGVPVFAWKGETLEDYWWCMRQAFAWPDGEGPTAILDDGGDATLFLSEAAAAQTDGLPEVEADASDERRALIACLRDTMATERRDYTAIVRDLEGVTEETTTGVRRLASLVKRGKLRFPAINVNDSVTKSKFDNEYGCRHSVIDGLNRATDILLGGKIVVVCGYGDVGKGCAEALRGQGARVVVTEIDPICALEAAIDGYEVRTLDDVVERADVVITATGCVNVVTVEHMARMKHQAVLGNIGHFDDEIDVTSLRQTSGVVRTTIKPQVDLWTFPDGHGVVILSEGRLLNLGNATGHPAFVMSITFTNQVLAQLELHLHPGRYPAGLYTLPKTLDEEVARLHLDSAGVSLTRLTEHQAAYLGLDVAGPYKPDSYRY